MGMAVYRRMIVMAKPFAEAVELAQHVLGQDGADLDGLDVALDERWGVSFATSEEIANELLALTMPFRSPLGGLLQAFVRPDGAAMVALMRVRATKCTRTMLSKRRA